MTSMLPESPSCTRCLPRAGSPQALLLLTQTSGGLVSICKSAPHPRPSVPSGALGSVAVSPQDTALTRPLDPCTAGSLALDVLPPLSGDSGSPRGPRPAGPTPTSGSPSGRAPHSAPGTALTWGRGSPCSPSGSQPPLPVQGGPQRHRKPTSPSPRPGAPAPPSSASTPLQEAWCDPGPVSSPF